MPGLDHVSPDTPVVITDPSERGKENHLWGDRLMVRIGNWAAWLFPILMIAIVSQVTMRKAGFNQAWLDDAQWWMYGFAMLAAFGYSITNESHVRVDIFHQNFSERKKARIEVFALGWLLLPFLAMMTDILAHYAWASFLAKEGSDSPNGLHRLYLLKISLPILFLCSIFAAWSTLKRNYAKISTANFWKLMLGALPFFLFVFERLVYYIFYVYIRFSQPDVNPRRIGKDPLMEHTLMYGIALLVIVLLIAFIKRNKGNRI